MKDIEFYACTCCQAVVDLTDADKQHFQSKPHNSFYKERVSPPGCEGMLTKPSTQRAWEEYWGQAYPKTLVEYVKEGFK